MSGRPTEPKVKLRGTVYVYSFTVAGRRYRGSTGERDRGRAESVLAGKWFDAHRAAHLPVAAGPAAQLDLAAIAARWLRQLEHVAAEKNPRYVERHKGDVFHLLRFFRLPGDVTDELWQATMRRMHAEPQPAPPPKPGKKPRAPRKLSWASLRHMTVTLRALLRFAATAKAIPSAPELRPPTNKLVKKEQAYRRPLTEGERERVLKALRANGDDRAARAWTAMVYSGLREGEAEALTLRWLDVAANLIRIPAKDAKSGEEEEIELHPLARRAIRAEANERGIKDKDAPVFGGFDLRKAWRRALVRAKVDPRGLTAHHSARHTFGTLVASRAKGDVTAVQAAGRWRSLAMAARYVHPSAARSRAAIRRL